jgi:hypothetical protein
MRKLSLFALATLLASTTLLAGCGEKTDTDVKGLNEGTEGANRDVKARERDGGDSAK